MLNDTLVDNSNAKWHVSDDMKTVMMTNSKGQAMSRSLSCQIWVYYLGMTDWEKRS